MGKSKISRHVEKNLVAGETVVLVGKRSSWPLVGYWIIGVVFCFLILIPTIWAAVKTVRWRCEELVVTNRCVRGRSGVLNIKTTSFPLENIQTINVEQSFGQRILRYGTVDITTAGDNAKPTSYPWMKRPEEIRRVALEQADAAKDDVMMRQAEFMVRAMSGKNDG